MPVHGPMLEREQGVAGVDHWEWCHRSGIRKGTETDVEGSTWEFSSGGVGW
jgi:hypothetical protein